MTNMNDAMVLNF